MPPRLSLANLIALLALVAGLNASAGLASSLHGEKPVVKPGATRGAASHLKLITLAPSNTELLCSLHDESDIEGVSSFCDFPPAISNKVRVGTFVSANLERLSRIKPDLILLVSGQEMLASQLKHNNFQTRILDNTHLSDIPTNLSILARLTGKEKVGEKMGKDFKNTMQDLGQAIGKQNKPPSVFYCVWPQPLMTVGHDSFINEMITACGGKNIAGSLTAAYPRYSFEQLVLQNPDYIILPYEARNQKFLENQPWTNLKAVKSKKVFFLEDQKHDMLSRPTLRIIKGAAWLSLRLHRERQEEIEAWQHSDAYLRCAKNAGL